LQVPQVKQIGTGAYLTAWFRANLPCREVRVLNQIWRTLAKLTVLFLVQSFNSVVETLQNVLSSIIHRAAYADYSFTALTVGPNGLLAAVTIRTSGGGGEAVSA
jgi:hypothetical protein